ncbi:MAG: PadR family transcriptional regulator, partial [Anaerolineales bacterium]
MLTHNDLLVLGFLLERPMHGYEINLALKEEDVGLWFEISTAAIYYSLNKLQRLCLIAEAHSRRSSGDKTIFHVTDSGREAFFVGMESLLNSEKPIHTEYDLGIFMLNRLSKNQAVRLLEKRIAFLWQLKAQLELKHDEAKGRLLKQAILQHSIAMAQLDVDWLADITEKLAEAEKCGSDYQSLMTLQ